jgi:hypothetical protein
MLIVMAFISFSCTEKLPLEPESPQQLPSLLHSSSSGGNVKVMTRNIYVGTDVDILLAAENPEAIPILAAQAFQTLIATNFPERAAALAEEVYQADPHLIGLQEVSVIRTQYPGDAVAGGIIPAEDVLMDYLEIFMYTLQAYGLDYQLVGMVENADVEVPMLSKFEPPFEFTDVRLTDYDVILARNDVIVKNVKTGNYRAKLAVPDVGIEIPRGYVRSRVVVEGCEYEFVNTHLEPADYGGPPLKVQVSQARELMSMLAPVKLPVILVGDFNSAAPHGQTYRIISGTHKYIDVWTENQLSDNLEGFTFGHDADLKNDTQNFWQRIDYIFVRDRKPYHKRTIVNSVEAYVTGDEAADKTPSGLWPSDHGGVVAGFQFVSDGKLATATNDKSLNNEY